jgi:hypothetical protein
MDPILTAIRACLNAHAQRLRDIKSTFDDRMTSCRDQLRALLNQCDTLAEPDRTNCRASALQQYRACADAAISARDADLAAADAELRFCLQQITP